MHRQLHTGCSSTCVESPCHDQHWIYHGYSLRINSFRLSSQIEPYGPSDLNETLPDLAGWLVDGETGEGLHKTVSVYLHLIHGSSTLDRTTTFGHHLREKLLCGNIAYYTRVGSVRSSYPKYASHGLWKPSSAITAKAPIPSPSAWKECLMKFAF